MIIKPYVEPNSQSLTGASLAKMASVQSCSLSQLRLHVRFGTESPKSLRASKHDSKFLTKRPIEAINAVHFFQLIADKLYAND